MQQTPKLSLQELKRRLEKAQEVVVDEKGHLHPPEDEEIKNKSFEQKTTLKPTRWF